MLLIDGGATPIPVPDWTTPVLAPLDHGGLAAQGDNVGSTVLLVISFLVCALALACAAAFLIVMDGDGVGFRRFRLIAIGAALAGMLACGIGAVSAADGSDSASTARSATAATWAQHRYSVKVNTSQASDLLQGQRPVVATLGIRTEVHLSQATDGKYYLFDATGRELPTTVDTKTGGE